MTLDPTLQPAPSERQGSNVVPLRRERESARREPPCVVCHSLEHQALDAHFVCDECGAVDKHSGDSCRAQIRADAEKRHLDAEAYAEAVAQRQAAASRVIVSASKETSDEWFQRYFEWRATAPGKNGSCRQDYAKYRTYASPRIGGKPIVAVTREDIEEIRDDLDDGVAQHMESEGEEGIAGAYAKGIWGVIVTGFNYAKTAKARTNLRVRSDSPCDDVKPPMKEGDLRKLVARPNEWLALATCDDVPLPRRETDAVMLYAYPRPGEGRVLRWERDVDFDMNEISVTHAWDYNKKRERAYPKTDAGVRKIPIEPELRPLLLRMCARAGGRGLVLPWLSSLGDETAMSKYFRDDLELAGVRTELTKKEYGVLRTRFRSLRDWGITWRLWRNGTGQNGAPDDNPLKVKKQAGHKWFSTTEGYVGDIEQLRAQHGVPFPPLPQSLLDAVGPAPSESTPRGVPSNGGCERRDLNPHGG